MHEEFSKLLLENFLPLQRYVNFKINNKHDAEDVIQEICLAATMKYDSLKNPSVFKQWLIGIANHKINDYYRKKAKVMQIPLESLSESALGISRFGITEQNVVRDTLELLGDKAKQILYLYYFKNLSQEDIAKQLSVPIGTVKSRLHYAKEKFIKIDRVNYLWRDIIIGKIVFAGNRNFEFEGEINGKKLSEMTLEELWQLFPIYLTEHQPCWQEWYSKEEDQLKITLSSTEKISHIGSTAIPFIWAKPIVDILVEIPRGSNLLDYKALVINNGYICMSQSENGLSFNKGYTENGFAERVFHLHLRYAGDNNELYFRDFLIEHPDVAKKYEKLKLELWKEYEYNRDGYTNAKVEFVQKYTEKAKLLYGHRY